jgi:DNA-directed RNA polymerase specialized sigma24 family protein
MDVAERNTGRLIQPSRKGDRAALGQLLDPYRNSLTLLARLQIGPELRTKIAVSDAVQETSLQADRSMVSFKDRPWWSIRRGSARSTLRSSISFLVRKEGNCGNQRDHRRHH